MRWSTVVAFALAALVLAGPARADVYRFTDERGDVHYVEGLDNVPERYRAQAARVGLRPRPDPPAVDPAAPGGAPQSARPGTTTVRFSPGKRIIVDVRINGGTPARLQLDTGADHTLVNPRVLAAAGVSVRAATTGQIRGVTGEDTALAFVIDSLEVGEARVGRMAVISYDMNQPDADGLLGRDFLDRFTVNIDSAQGIVSLTPR